MLWFQEVNYFSVFLLKFQVRLILLGIVTGVTAVYLLGNLALAERLKHAHRPNEGSQGEGKCQIWILRLRRGMSY